MNENDPTTPETPATTDTPAEVVPATAAATDAAGGKRGRLQPTETVESWRDKAVRAATAYPGGFDAKGAYAIAKAHFGWPIGKLLTLVEYQEAVNTALTAPIGGSKKLTGVSKKGG